MKTRWLITVMTGWVGIISVHAADHVKAFPPADRGMVRYVLQLPPQENESLFKVELLVGKTLQTDARNRYFFGGKIEASTIKGWGFTRYDVNKLGPMVGTVIAVDPIEPKVDRFIALGGEPYPVRYNGKLPLAVYVPEGVEVRYRVWTAGSDAKSDEKGQGRCEGMCLRIGACA
ncbi:MAG: ecotin family protein [Nitrospira sp.]|jgi:ecotin|nr:ecotin family protein [Nitrospira sp.]MDH5195566.1 ecotin family protein [Nitrospira sp.]